MFTRILDLPKLNEKDIEEAINYEVEQSIPIAANDLIYDWQTINQTEEKSTIVLAAAPKSIVNSYMQLFKILNVEPLALEMSLAAIARSMVSNKEKAEPVLILDIGGQASNLAVFDSNLRVTGSHPIRGLTIRSQLSQSLKISDKEAEKTLKEGIKEKSKASDIIKESIDKLAAESNNMVQYFTEKNKGQKVSKMLLCGGLAFVPWLPEYFHEKTKLETKVGNPWVNISIYPIKPVPKEEAPSYASAIGLCLRGFLDD